MKVSGFGWAVFDILYCSSDYALAIRYDWRCHIVEYTSSCS